MHIKVVADPLPSKADGEGFEWTVNITSDGKPLKQNLSLRDPLDAAGKDLCSWYLEKYLGNEPYSTSKARSAAALTDKYGQSLLDQLQLADLISDDEQNLTVEVEDVSVSNSGHNSVHQLSWEFLEDEKLWKAPLAVCVRRSSGNPGQPLLARERIFSWSRKGKSRQQINILLVTARDLAVNTRVNMDINPTIVSDLLAGVKSRLRSTKAAIDLKLEVVRPGTWEALKQHLEKSHRIHGRGYYHMIHFDVHGKVKEQRSSNIGLLYFCDPNIDSTRKKPVLASKVAREVGKQGIPIVILNACESARANAGEDANIANNFAKAGVNNVLAMTYQASEGATKLFLDSFYMNFLVEGRSFTDSAMLARRTLRLQTLRQARFQQRLPLCDWFIPVVYTSSPDLALVRPEVTQESASCDEIPTQTEEHAPQGREFDLLRLEKNLIANKILYLSGPPGIGKTTFLRYVCSSWKNTSFVDAVVFLDPTSLICSMDDFYKEIIKQLRSSDFGQDVNNSSFESKDESAETLLEILTDVRATFILDGLVDFRISEGRNPQDKLITKFLVPDIVQFLERAMSQPGELRQESHIVIVSGRSKELGELIGSDNKSHYELKGLRLREAVDIVHQIAAPSSTDQSDGKIDQFAEIRKTEPLAHLLQGNPAALIQISTICRNSGTSHSQMYDILHAENPVHNLDPSLLSEHLELLQEFKELIFSLPKDGIATLLMLSWYWHEGPLISDFVNMLVTMKIASTKSTVQAALRQASRWGYIELHPEENRVSWINSLFTIFCRVIACSSYSGFMFSTGDQNHDFQANFAANEMGLLVANAEDYLPWPSQPMKGLEYAVRLVYTVLSSHFLRDVHRNYWEYLIHYIIAYRNSNDRLSSLVLYTSMNMPAILDQQDSCKQNFIFLLKICRGHGMFPIPQGVWPTTSMTSQGHFLRKACNTEETSIIAFYYEQMLNGAVKYSKIMGGKDAVKPDDLSEIISIAGALADMYRQDIPLPENHHLKIIEFVTQIKDESERAFGPAMNDQTVASMARFSISKATALLDERKFEESRAEIERATQTLKALMDPSRPGTQTQLNNFLEGKSPEEKELWQRFIESSRTNVDELGKAWDMTILSVRGESIEKLTGSGLGDPASNLFSMLTQVLPQIATNLESQGVRLESIEREMNRGHWLRAMGHHSGLAIKSMESLDFDEVLEHIQAQEDLAMQNEPEGQFLEKAADAKEVVGHIQTYFSNLTSNDGPNYEEMMKTGDSLVDMLKKKGIAPPEITQMSEIIKESMVRDNDSNLAHNWAPGILSFGSGDLGESIQQFWKKHLLKASRDTEYQHTMVRSLSNTLATLRELENAEDDSDVSGIFTHLTQLDDLAADEVFGELVNKDKVQERRVWNTMRLFKDHWDQWNALIEEKRFEEARIVAAKYDTVMSLGQANQEVQGLFEKVGSFETLVLVQHFTHFIELGKQAMQKADFKAAQKHFQDAINLNEKDVFAKRKVPLSYVNMSNLLNATQSELNRCALHVALNERRWSNGVALCEKWRTQPEIWKSAMEGDMASLILKMERTCSDCHVIQDFYKNFMGLNIVGAAARLQDMKKLYKTKLAQKNVGTGGKGVRLSSNTSISKELLDGFESLLVAETKAMLTGGPEAAYRVATMLQEMVRKTEWDKVLAL